MKKIIVLMAVFPVVFLCLSGCDTLSPVPTDEECRELISTHLLVHSDFYETTDTIDLGDWLGVGTQIRSFSWCHTYAAGTYCGVGSIKSNRVITYEGE